MLTRSGWSASISFPEEKLSKTTTKGCVWEQQMSGMMVAKQHIVLYHLHFSRHVILRAWKPLSVPWYKFKVSWDQQASKVAHTYCLCLSCGWQQVLQRPGAAFVTDFTTPAIKQHTVRMPRMSHPKYLSSLRKERASVCAKRERKRLVRPMISLTNLTIDWGDTESRTKFRSRWTPYKEHLPVPAQVPREGWKTTSEWWEWYQG